MTHVIRTQIDTKENAKFINWIASAAGCDGGNINGSIWFFALEWGGRYPPEQYIGREPVLHHPEIGDEYGKFLDGKTRVHEGMAKFYSVLLGHNISDYEMVYEKYRMFRSGSDTYKGNLYTVSFPQEKSSLFTPKHQELTGCASKSEYKDLHRKYRFPMLKSWTEYHKPKLIICFGSSQEYLCDYQLAFSGKYKGNNPVYQPAGDSGVTLMVINNNQTVLAVAPFLSFYRNCLGTDEKIQAVAQAVAQFCDKVHEGAWLTNTM